MLFFFVFLCCFSLTTNTIYYRAILLNKDAIAVSQDPLGQMGMRVSGGDTTKQIWARNLANGDVAVALYVLYSYSLLCISFFFSFFLCSSMCTACVVCWHVVVVVVFLFFFFLLLLLLLLSFFFELLRYNTGAAIPILPPFDTTCSSLSTGWTLTKGGYYEACGGAAGDFGQFTNLTIKEAQHQCCLQSKCAGFSYAKGSGFYKEVQKIVLLLEPTYEYFFFKIFFFFIFLQKRFFWHNF